MDVYKGPRMPGSVGMEDRIGGLDTNEERFARANADAPITTMVQGAPTPREMLVRARQLGKTEQEINAFAATQPMTPVAIKGARVFVQDCFGRTFGLDDVAEAEIKALVAKGVPYTAYSNRKERRDAVKAEARTKRSRKADKARPAMSARFADVADPALAATADTAFTGLTPMSFDALVRLGDTLDASPPAEDDPARVLSDATAATILEIMRAAHADHPVSGYRVVPEIDAAVERMCSAAHDAGNDAAYDAQVQAALRVVRQLDLRPGYVACAVSRFLGAFGGVEGRADAEEIARLRRDVVAARVLDLLFAGKDDAEVDPPAIEGVAAQLRAATAARGTESYAVQVEYARDALVTLGLSPDYARTALDAFLADAALDAGDAEAP